MIFTDRSRYITYFICQFERFLAYHFQGRGITKKGSAIPLITGTHAHSAVEMILKLVMETGELPRSEDVRHVIEEVTKAYQAQVKKTGLLDLQENERVEFVVDEQTTLISGLIWAWAGYILPYFLEEFQVLHVEQEMERIVGCDCGLSGVGKVEDHSGRNCNCVVIMTRPDIVAKKYATDELAYIEVKTGSRVESGTFEGDIQFAFGAAGIEGYMGKELVESRVHALSKGTRRKEWNPETRDYSLPPKQSSSLCYAYVKPAISGMVPQDIKFKGKGKGVTKAHRKTPVWEIPFQDMSEGIPPLEHYISLMSDEELESHVDVFGPFPYPKQQVEETIIEIEVVERRIDKSFGDVNYLIEKFGFAQDEVQLELHHCAPKSWACRRYGSICSFYPICNKMDGWWDPCANLGFEPRSANHPVEFEFEV